MTLLPFYWCFDAFSLLVALAVCSVLFLVLLVLITVGFGILAGKGAVMGSLLVLVKVLLLLFWTSLYLSFTILLGRLVLCLLVLFLYDIVLSSLLLRHLFGSYLFLVTFLG